MKLSLKNVGGKLRLLVRPLGDALKFVKNCCCVNQDNSFVVLFFECCNPVPRFAISRKAYLALSARCPQVAPERLLLVKFRNEDGNACYREGFEISKEEAIRISYTIYESDDVFDCSRGDEPEANSTRCGWGRCRQCYSNQCCLIALYDKQCTIAPFTPNRDPKKNICCNYGRKAKRRAFYSARRQDLSYTWLNSSVPDPFCPIGCFSPLLREKQFSQTTYELEDEFVKCDENGDGGASGWVRTVLVSRKTDRLERSIMRYGFDGDPNLPSCLSFREDVLANYFAEDDNWGDPRNAEIFPWFFPQREERVDVRPNFELPYDNCYGWYLTHSIPWILNEPNSYVPEGRHSVQCDEVNNHVFECVIADGLYRLVISTDVYKHDISCNRGGYLLRHTGDLYFNVARGADQPQCPPQNTLLRRTRVDVECTYFIESISRSFCNPRSCDGYAENGSITPIPLPEIPDPITGALSLL